MLVYCYKLNMNVLDEAECIMCQNYKPCSFCGCHHDMTGGIMHFNWDHIFINPRMWLKIWYFNKKNFGIYLTTDNYYHEISTSKIVFFHKVLYFGSWVKDLRRFKKNV